MQQNNRKDDREREKSKKGKNAKINYNCKTAGSSMELPSLGNTDFRQNKRQQIFTNIRVYCNSTQILEIHRKE
jgi:hypothetical protein